MKKKLLPIETKKQRLVIYEKALAIIKETELNKSDEHKDSRHGLCFELKDLSGLDFYDWNIPETDVIFPEFGNFIDRYTPTKFLELLNKNGYPNNKWRIKVLEECIKLCK